MDSQHTQPGRRLLLVIGLIFLMAFTLLTAQSSTDDSTPAPLILANPGWVSTTNAIWQSNPGHGFKPSTQLVSLEAGAAVGPAWLGSQEHHHLALLSLAYGHMFAPVQAEDHWWRGNFAIHLELFGGIQFVEDLNWLVGVTPHIRYNFATGSQWIPFLGVGAGFTLTGIGAPDAGSLFEFNLQGTMGIHYFLRDTLALTLETRMMHISNAGISNDNYGINNIVAMFGVSRFF